MCINECRTHQQGPTEREEELVGEGNVKALRRLAKALPKDRQLSIVDIQRDVIFLNSCNAMDLDDGEVRDAMPRIVQCCKKSGHSTQRSTT